jgi:hypothetical protein
MKEFLKISIIAVGISLIVIFGITFWIFRPQVPVGSEILPTTIIMEKLSPNKKVMAQIIEGEKIEGFNPLGSNKRFYLALQYQNSRHLILRDLSEGFGSYEGGVLGLKWLDSSLVYIERIISDHQADIIYDLSINAWQDAKKQ